MDWCHPGLERAETDSFVREAVDGWRSGDAYYLVIEDAGSGRLLGSTGLNDIHARHRRGNLGYWVRTSETGKGVATAAARLVAEFGLNDLGLVRIEVLAAVGNVASQRVALSAGAVREGIDRAGLVVHGEPVDALRFSIIAADLR